MKKLTQLLIGILVILIAIEIYLTAINLPYAYTKIITKVNFTEPEIGNVTKVSDKSGKTVLFEQNHQNTHSVYTDYSKFTSIFADAGFKIQIPKEDFIEKVKRVDVLVLLSPDISYSTEEIQAISDAVETGTTLIILADKGLEETNNKLTIPFGITFNKDFIYDLKSYTILFKYPIISNFAETALTGNLKKIAIYEGCSLNYFGKSQVIAFASDAAVSSEIEYRKQLPVIAISTFGKGRIFAICDTDLFTNKFIGTFDIDALAKNLVNWS